MGYRTVVLLVACLAAACAAAAGAAETQVASLESLSAVLGKLRQGGYVIYMRHMPTTPVAIGLAMENLADCKTQRNLSPEGRLAAIRMGKAIKSLRIPIGKVKSSPYCRAMDSARLAFGHAVADADLGFVLATGSAETQRRAAALRSALATTPDPGSNSVLVSHSANLFEAAGIFAEPEGASYVFRPLGGDRFEAVARVLPDEWERAVAAKERAP